MNEERIKTIARRLWFAMTEEGIERAEFKVNLSDESPMYINVNIPCREDE